MAPFVAATIAGLTDFLDLSAADEREARRLGLLDGPDLLDSILASLPPEPAERADPIRRKDLNRLSRHVRRAARESLVELHAKTLDGAFVDRAQEILRRAALEKWSRERFVGRIVREAEAFGEGNFRRSYAETWYRTIVFNNGYNQAATLAYGAEPTRRLYPYLAYNTMRDSRVRPSHRLLDTFVARSNWPGWATYRPPLEWGCRCRLVPVSVVVARELGWEDDFPRGTSYLETRDGIVPGRAGDFVVLPALG